MAALSACVTLPEPVTHEFRGPEAAEHSVFGDESSASAAQAPRARPRQAIDVARLPLSHGQIVVSEAGGPMSLLYSLFARDYAPWVHAGIVAVEGQETVVYEASGSFFPVPGRPPTTTVSGTVRRISVEHFVRGKRIVGLYAPSPQADRDRLVAYAREQYERATPFDPYFDTDDPGALYCTELVARALIAAGATVEPTPTRANASLARMREWLRLSSNPVYLAGSLVEPGLQMGRWSPDLSDAQVDAYFSAKRELHLRFGASARLGHVFSWERSSLRLRDRVARFFDAALAAAELRELDASEVSFHVQRLAREFFDGASTPATQTAGRPAAVTTP